MDFHPPFFSVRRHVGRVCACLQQAYEGRVSERGCAYKWGGCTFACCRVKSACTPQLNFRVAVVCFFFRLVKVEFPLRLFGGSSVAPFLQREEKENKYRTSLPALYRCQSTYRYCLDVPTQHENVDRRRVTNTFLSVARTTERSIGKAGLIDRQTGIDGSMGRARE